jgi:cytochrome c oxidase subunit 2
MSSYMALATTVPAALLGDGSFWLPPPDSTTAPAMDSVFYLILAVCAIFFFLVVAFMIYFAVRYRQRPGHTAEKTATHSNVLEITWTVIPLLIVAYIFYAGFSAYLQMHTAPQNSYEILVSAQKWSWFFTYPNGHVDGDLHVPVDQPVKLIMSSKDVIHSLSIPAFRVKMDCVPGRYTYAWFQGTTPGTYDLYCTEYCGDSHSDMLANVVVHEPGQFDAWLEKAANFFMTLPPAEAGKILFERRCNQCHSNDGTAKTGPSFKGIFGEEHKMKDGSTVKVDEQYIRESILDPQARIREGFPPAMPTFQGMLDDSKISFLIEYIKSLK